MAKFKKGDRVRHMHHKGEGTVLCFSSNGTPGVDYDVWEKGHDLFHNAGVKTRSKKSGYYANDIELITDYQPITPKVGERYRVVKEIGRELPKGFITEVIRHEEYNKWRCTDTDKDSSALYGISLSWTTEYLELVEEEQHTVTAVTSPCERDSWHINKGYISCEKEILEQITKEYSNKGLPFSMYETIKRAEAIKKTKLTTMQKLTSALKRALSADKQTLFKAGVIGQDLELSSKGQNGYIDALFNNEGKHKEAVAEMVAMAQAELDEAKA